MSEEEKKAMEVDWERFFNALILVAGGMIMGAEITALKVGSEVPAWSLAWIVYSGFVIVEIAYKLSLVYSTKKLEE